MDLLEHGTLDPDREIHPADAMQCGPLWVSPEEMCEVRVGSERVDVSGARLRMIVTLLRAGGRVVGRPDLYRAGCGREMAPRSRAIDVHIARIRKALGPVGRYILTVQGVGYRLDVAGLQRAISLD